MYRPRARRLLLHRWDRPVRLSPFNKCLAFVLEYHQIGIAGTLFAFECNAHTAAAWGRIVSARFGDVALLSNPYAANIFVLFTVPHFNCRLMQIKETASRTAERIVIDVKYGKWLHALTSGMRKRSLCFKRARVFAIIQLQTDLHAE